MAAELGCSREDILPNCKLPGDVMVSILSNLPVKSLLKFKAVSKPWFSFISCPSFIKIHLHRQSLIRNNLLMSFGDWEDIGYGLLPHNHDKNTDVLILESQSLFSSIGKSLSIIDSCNGLVCLFAPSWGFSLILWNPATRKYRYLDLPKEGYRLSYSTLGLCYVEATNDFKIVVWTDTHIPSHRQYLFVYTLSSDSWEKLEYDAEKAPVEFEHPTFMSGCMHWLAKTCTCSFLCTCSSSNVIMAFDVTDGAMSFFGVPDNNHGSESESLKQTLVIRGCLSIVIFLDFEEMDSGFEIWVMEEYGVEGSWVKRFTFQGLTQITVPLMSWNDGEIVFTSEMRDSSILTFYDPFSKEKYCLNCKSNYVYQVFTYAESLASVGTKAENAPFLTNWGLIFS